MTDWKQEAVSGLNALLDLRRDGNQAHEWKTLGIAEDSDENAWLRLDMRGSRLNADALTNVHLGGSQSPEEMLSYPVSVTRLTDGVLYLKKPGKLPPDARQVWNLRPPTRYLVTRLRDGLRELESGSLADRLAAGRLDQEFVTDVGRPAGFLDGQTAAYQACFTSGVRLVWGPPGTGKTRVLARAIEDLVARGDRVLLVSTANIAVDNALLAVVRNMRPEAGVVVRVGTPHLRELAEDDNVALDRLTLTVTSQVDEERLAIEEQIAQHVELDDVIGRLEQELAGFDHEAYFDARRRIANSDQLSLKRNEGAEMGARLAALREVVQRVEKQRIRLDGEWRAIEPARNLLAQAAAAESRLRDIDGQLEVKRSNARRTREAAENATGLLKRRRAAKAATVAENDEKYYLGWWRSERARLQQVIEGCRRQAYPGTDESVGLLRRRIEGILAEEAAARAAEAPVSRAFDELQHALRVAETADLAGPEHELLVAEAVAKGAPLAFERLVSLRKTRDTRAKERAEYERRHRELIELADRLRSDAQREILNSASVIATTLARSRVHAAVGAQEFDVVLVDEVGAAPLAEVLLAVSWAGRTAVLLGDFLQLGPIAHEDTKKLGAAHKGIVNKWVNGEVFGHCGIRTGSDAQRERGCVALSYQFRFGPALCEFANDVIYRDLRPGYEATGGRRPDDTKMVLVDTDGLPELSALQRDGATGNWWMIGALLSEALAEYHVVSGDSHAEGVGVVAPYRSQVNATLAALRDKGGVVSASVGTVHSTQGREFDTVIFDLVEPHPDDRTRAGAAWSGWMFKAKTVGGGAWEYDGVRLFGVAITRAKHQLYLICSWTTVQGAEAGPLAVVKRLVEERKIRRVRAAVILGMEEGPRRTPLEISPVEADLRDKLRGLVRVDEIHDEITFDRVLREHLGRAERSIWMWAPWMGVQGLDAIPIIEEAVRRGVAVTVFVRDDDAIRKNEKDQQGRLEKLRESGANVVQAEVEHRKIVVLDEQQVLLGSFNPLSHVSGREIMVSFRGRRFAEQVLTSMRAKEFSSPPHCDSCDRTFVLRRFQGKKSGRGPWFWRCPGCRAERDIDVRRPAERTKPRRSASRKPR